MYIERVHPASASIIQRGEQSEVSYMCVCTHSEKLIFESNKLEKVHLIGCLGGGGYASDPTLAATGCAWPRRSSCSVL
jgi:hypothetical protein